MNSLLNPEGAFNLSAILRLAHDMARRTVANPLPGFTRKTYREAFPACLAQAWKYAKQARAEAHAGEAEKATKAHRAALLFGAAMIDSTSRAFAARAAVETRFAA